MKTKIIHAIVLFILSIQFKAQSQVNEEWVRNYNGPGNSTDKANAIAVDDSGNVYVTGYSHGGSTVNDYATIKYNSSGDTMWVVRYNGPGNLGDQANAIAVDGSGNVYVTGSSVGSGTQGDYCTIKYNSSGDSLWVARYNGPGNGGDVANSIAVDANGNVYVTGRSDRITGVIWDFATIKYNSSGDRQWVARYSPDTTALKNSSAISVKVDELGDVYVAGTGVFGTGTNGDYATVKYNSSGDFLWARMYEGPGDVENVAASAWSLAVDGSGNAYVTGFSSDGVSFDYATLKYNASGAAQWVARYDGPGNNADYARSAAIDASGNVFVTGDSRGNGTGIDYATIKYNSSGDSLWVARYNGPGNGSDFGRSLAVDDLGNVYVTGKSYGGSGTQDDFSTIKYNSSGDSMWVMRYNGPNNSSDEPNALAVDKLGNVYVTGWSTGTGTGLDYATIKYSESVTGVREYGHGISKSFRLSQNYPNPFNPSTTIQFDIPSQSHVTLAVYNTLGQEVVTLLDETISAGTYQVDWNAAEVASGMYFYRLTAGAHVFTYKMVLLR